MNLKDKIYNVIINVPNFPKQGVNFKDISPIFSNPQLIEEIIDKFAEVVKNIEYDVIASPELRGYLFGIPLAIKTKKPFIFIRKKGKLPRETVSVSYELEYGTAELEIHKDTIKPGQRVLIVDDLLATGGTINAIEKLIDKVGGTVVGSIYLIELDSLKGRKKLNHPIFSLINYE